MDLFQLFLGIYFAVLGAYLSILMGRVLKQNERVLEKIDQGFRRMDERTEKIAHLIVLEGEKTRELIKSLGKDLDYRL